MAKAKAAIILIAVLVVWAALLLLTWRGWYQIFCTIAAFVSKHDAVKAYNYKLWLAQDQDVNVIFNGSEDETISSRIGAAYLNGSKTAVGVRFIVDLLFYVAIQQKNHCIESIEWDEQK